MSTSKRYTRRTMITIKKDIILIEVFNNETYKYDTLELKSMYDALNQEVTIEPDVTVEDLMNLLFKYVEEVDKIFVSFTEGFKLKKYIESMNKNSETIRTNPYIEFYHFIDLFDKDFNCTVELKARDNNVDDDKSVEYLPISDLKQYFIKLNKSFKMNIIIDISSESITYDGEKEFMFFDVIAKFLYTITLMGYPEEQLLNIENIVNSITDIKDNPEIDIEQIKKLLQQAIDEQRYEFAENLKKILDGNI